MTEAERDEALRLASKLRANGESVNLLLHPQKPKKFFSRADQGGAAKAIFMGPDDVAAGVVRIKDLATRTESELCIK
jgi:histidyl-tRNA synthetase